MNKHIMVLSIIAVFAVAAGVWLQYQDSALPVEKDFLFADLLDNAAQIEQIEINNSSGNVFNAQLKKGQWMAKVEDFGGSYPAEQRKLSELLKSFTAARLVEAKTAKPNNYQYLGLQGLDETDSLASLVSFATQEKSWQVLVGNQTNIGIGNYVRLPKDRQSWLIDQNIVLPTDQQSWLKQPILPFEGSFLAKISRIDKQRWVFEKSSEDAEYVLSGLPSERSLKYGSVLSAFANNIVQLNFEKLHNLQDDLWSKLATQVELEIVTVDGMVFKLTVAEHDDKVYAKFRAENQQAYWLDWIYQISSFSAQQLSKTKEDFLRDVNDASSENGSSASATDEGESPY
ncbi:MAG: hypothetical protein ACI88A_000066 [Paraglaciecola sp.]|jgi:hypothetical protein